MKTSLILVALASGVSFAAPLRAPLARRVSLSLDLTKLDLECRSETAGYGGATLERVRLKDRSGVLDRVARADGHEPKRTETYFPEGSRHRPGRDWAGVSLCSKIDEIKAKAERQFNRLRVTVELKMEESGARTYETLSLRLTPDLALSSTLEVLDP